VTRGRRSGKLGRRTDRTATPGAAMSAEAISVVRRFFDEVWNQRRTETIEELLDEESVCQSDLGELCGPGGFRAAQYEPMLAAFPDARVTVEGIMSVGDEVAVRWSAEGTHTGKAMGLAPTGVRATFHGMSWIRVRDGKLRLGWQWSNIPAVLAGLRR
jgi:predicted ester cyclase